MIISTLRMPSNYIAYAHNRVITYSNLELDWINRRTHSSGSCIYLLYETMLVSRAGDGGQRSSCPVQTNVVNFHLQRFWTCKHPFRHTLRDAKPGSVVYPKRLRQMVWLDVCDNVHLYSSVHTYAKKDWARRFTIQWWAATRCSWVSAVTSCIKHTLEFCFRSIKRM